MSARPQASQALKLKSIFQPDRVSRVTDWLKKIKQTGRPSITNFQEWSYIDKRGTIYNKHDWGEN